MPLEADIAAMAKDKNFAAMTVLLSDGTPMTHVMWVHADDEHLLINTEVDRAKFKALQRDPRVTVTVIDRNNPYHYAEVRGRVADSVTGPEARADIDMLSQKYNGNDYPESAIGTERVIVKIAPDRQRIFGA
ncbi:MAG TPA: TIGR03618 family F420-dependent PPOX class oxidoreductase [Acidimicrobiales bacterium]|jgi:PPOX class probable F420-dependent enzyme|nr:TIGR03618 family F420-dependent PPOX class oxidoreductase [Acidimicrobiales bacterium]